MPDHMQRSTRAARQARLPEQIQPLPRPVPHAMRRRAQLAAAIVFSLVGLVMASAWVEICAQPGSCQRQASGPRAALPEPAEDNLEAPRPALPDTARPILDYAFAALPLAFETEVSRSYILPPGKTVADLATLEGRLDLAQVALLAIVRTDGTRRALVRLPDGRILRLQEGDVFDSGTVVAIGEDALYLFGHDNRPRALILGG